jgi:regulatory protein YycH of two-component signal transduction system YycFG
VKLNHEGTTETTEKQRRFVVPSWFNFLEEHFMWSDSDFAIFHGISRTG